MVPAKRDLSGETKVLSYLFAFEDALRLRTSLEDGVLWLNRVYRQTAEGKRAAIRLNIRLEDGRFYLMKSQVPAESDRRLREPPELEEEE